MSSRSKAKSKDDANSKHVFEAKTLEEKNDIKKWMFWDNECGMVTQEQFERVFNKPGKPKRYVALERYTGSDADFANLHESEFQNIPQSDPKWHQLRRIPGSITASNVCKMLGGHCAEYANQLDVSDIMLSKDGEMIEWTIFKLTRRYPNLIPSTETDAIMSGWVTWGKNHEFNSIAEILQSNPKFVAYEQGLNRMTPAILQSLGLTNLLTGAPLTMLSFLLGISPDLELRWTSKASGAEKRAIYETKAPIDNLPVVPAKSNADYKNGYAFPGLRWFPVKNGRKPYDKFKGYYVWQPQLQAAVRQTERAYTGCWTPHKGMRRWKTRYDKRFMELTLTLLEHIVGEIDKDYDTLATHAHYFDMARGTAPLAVKKLHAEMIEIAVQLAAGTRHSKAKQYADIPDTKLLTNKMLGLQPGEQWPKKRYVFPDHPEEVNAYNMLHALGKLLPSEEWNAPLQSLRVLHMADQVDDRVYNLQTLLHAVPLLAYFEGGVAACLGERTQHEEVNNFVTYRERICKNAETYLLPACMLLYRCESESPYVKPSMGDPTFGTEQFVAANIEQRSRQLFEALANRVLEATHDHPTVQGPTLALLVQRVFEQYAEDKASKYFSDSESSSGNSLDKTVKKLRLEEEYKTLKSKTLKFVTHKNICLLMQLMVAFENKKPAAERRKVWYGHFTSGMLFSNLRDSFMHKERQTGEAFAHHFAFAVLVTHQQLEK